VFFVTAKNSTRTIMTVREGSLEAPKRRPIDGKNPEFFEEGNLFKELERLRHLSRLSPLRKPMRFFPDALRLIDNGETGEVDGVAKEAYWDVVDQCYLCDMCFMTKCPICRRIPGTSTYRI
jgi:hypothetical protein